jgi:hypothetical protein
MSYGPADLEDESPIFVVGNNLGNNDRRHGPQYSSLQGNAIGRLISRSIPKRNANAGPTQRCATQTDPLKMAFRRTSYLGEGDVLIASAPRLVVALPSLRWLSLPAHAQKRFKAPDSPVRCLTFWHHSARCDFCATKRINKWGIVIGPILATLTTFTDH